MRSYKELRQLAINKSCELRDFFIWLITSMCWCRDEAAEHRGKDGRKWKSSHDGKQCHEQYIISQQLLLSTADFKDGTTDYTANLKKAADEYWNEIKRDDMYGTGEHDENF